MSQTQNAAIAVVGIDIGKNSFHIVGQDERGAIVLRQKWSRGQVEARLPICRRVWLAWRRASGRIISVVELQSAWPRCAADAGEVRAAIFQGPKERFP